MKKRLVFTGLLVAAVVTTVALSGSALAKAGRGVMDAGERMARIHGMVASLDLTRDQKAEIMSIVRDEKPRIDPLINELCVNDRALRKATDSADCDNATIRVLSGREGKILARLTVEGANVKTQVFAVLTPHQRSKVMDAEDHIQRDLSGRHFGDTLSQVLD